MLTTSVRFFDHTAHDYVNAVCDDLDMRHVVEPGTFTVYVGGSSVDVREARFRVTGTTMVVPDRGLVP